MKKFGAIIISLIVLAIFAMIAWWLYRNFHSTPALIGNLLLILTGVLISYTLYIKIAYFEKDVEIIKEEAYPEIEEGLIYASVDDFANKFDRVKGKLFIAGISLNDEEYNLVDVKYKKLTDEVTFTFSPSLTINLKGLATIAVGDHQFLIFGFDYGKIRNKKTYELNWYQDKLLITGKDGFEKKLQIPSKMPTITFDWPSTY